MCETAPVPARLPCGGWGRAVVPACCASSAFPARQAGESLAALFEVGELTVAGGAGGEKDDIACGGQLARLGDGGGEVGRFVSLVGRAQRAQRGGEGGADLGDADRGLGAVSESAAEGGHVALFVAAADDLDHLAAREGFQRENGRL